MAENGELPRRFLCDVVNPQVAGLRGALVRNQQARAHVREGRGISGVAVKPCGQVDFCAVARSAVGEIGVAAAVLVDLVGELLSVGRKIAGVRFPLQIGDPREFFRGEINLGDVAVAAGAVRRRPAACGRRAKSKKPWCGDRLRARTDFPARRWRHQCGRRPNR